MKKRNLFTLLLAAVLLVGCQGESVPSPDSSSQGGSDSSPISETSDSSSTSETPTPSESTGGSESAGGSESTGGSDSTSEPEPVPGTYTLSYVAGENNPEDLSIDIMQNYEPVADLTLEPADFESGTALAVSPYTEQTGIAIKDVLLNGTALEADSSGQYPFVMPMQDSTITVNYAAPHALAATYTTAGVAEMFFYEQDSFDPSATAITSAIEGASIFAYLSFSDGYIAKEFGITVKNGEEVLSPDATWQAQGHYVYHFSMPDADVSLSVELTAIEYTWDYYFTSTYAVMEENYNASMTIAEIKEYVPFIRLGLYEFSSVRYEFFTDEPNTFSWMLGGEPTDDIYAVYDEYSALDAILAEVLPADEGWLESSSGGYFKDVNDDFQIQVGPSYIEDADTGLYVPVIYFSAWRYVEPTNWVETWESIDGYYSEYESYYTFSITVDEINANVPFFLYRFYGCDFLDSQFLSGNYAWGLINESTADNVTADVAAIDAVLAENLTEAAGWTKGTVSEGVTGYSKNIDGKQIWVYATVYNGYYGDQYYAALVFDAKIMNWYGYLESYVYYFEEYFGYPFTVTAANIETTFPFIDSQYNQEVNFFNSSMTIYDAAWAIGVGGIETVEEQTAVVAAMNAEMDAVYGAATSEWTQSPLNATITNSYMLYDEATEYLYAIYVMPFTYTEEDATGATITLYGAYFVFDCQIPNWGNYFFGLEDLEDTYSFTMTIADIKGVIPFWYSDYVETYNAFASQNTTGYNAWALGVKTTSEADQAAAVTAMNAELAANLTAEKGWTSTTTTSGLTIYYIVDGFTIFYVFVVTAQSTDSTTGAASYDAYFYFDAMWTWGSLSVIGYEEYTTASVVSSFERSSTFTVSMSDIATSVPYIPSIAWTGIDYQESTINEAEYCWYASTKTTADTAEADKAAIIAALQTALEGSSFTYNETTGRFESVDAETGDTTVIIVETDSTSTEIHVVFDIVKATTEPAAQN